MLEHVGKIDMCVYLRFYCTDAAMAQPFITSIISSGELHKEMLHTHFCHLKVHSGKLADLNHPKIFLNKEFPKKCTIMCQFCAAHIPPVSWYSGQR